MRPLLVSSLFVGLLLLDACAGSQPVAGPRPVSFSARNRYDRQGRPRGRWRTYYADSVHAQLFTDGRYRHGRPIRMFSYYAPTGALDHTEKYGREGFCEVRYWHPGGQLARLGHAQWLTGKKGARFYWFGPWTSFTEHGDTTALDLFVYGTQAQRITYDNGRRIAIETCDAAGRP